MPNYDFSTLSPADFEELSRDLLQSKLGLKLESFRSGRDRGIDLRYSMPKDGKLLIVQAKHWAKSGYAKLKRCLVNQEKPKATKLQPSRYIVATSVSFTPGEKDELFEAMMPLIQSPKDIIGQEDLNNLLGEYGDVEKRHFKLWLPSTSILERLLANGVFTQSALEVEEIKRHLSMFVHTEAFDRALDILESSGVCMLTGIPGIGKTTTARLLVAQHLTNDFDGYYLAGRAENAFKVFNPEAKQIFFYDDFLGATSLRERLPKNEDVQLLQLMKACRRSPARKRLVLTTREYLFEQARQQHEILARNAGIEAAKSTVQLEDYTAKIRARILVNHLYFHGIESDVCSNFVSSGLARKTLDHENYNPRIVETMCEMHIENPCTPSEFGKEFLARLDDPTSIWEHAFRRQLTDDAQKLLLAFAMHGTNVTVNSLKAQYRLFREASGMDLTGYDATFSDSLKELEGNFLAIRKHRDTHYLVYHNPAIEDFTDAELARDGHTLKVGLDSFSFEKVLQLVSKKLVKDHKETVTANDLIKAMERSDKQTRFYVIEDVRDLLVFGRPSAALAIVEWISLLQKFRSLAALSPALEKAKAHLLEGDFSAAAIDDLCKLYSAYAKAASPYKSHNTLPAAAVWKRLIDHCEFPEEFNSLLDLVDTDQQEDLEIVRQEFEAKCLSNIESIITDSTTSDQASGALYEFENVAERLGIEGSSLGLDGIQDQIDEMSEDEERRAEMDEDERHIERFHEQQESQAIDDILDSIRDTRK